MFGKEGSPAFPGCCFGCFVVRIERRVVGRSCGEPLLRKVSSAEPWKLRLMDFLLDKDTLDPSVGGGGRHAIALKEHSLKHCFPTSVNWFQWFPWSFSWPFCCFCLSYNSLPTLNHFSCISKAFLKIWDIPCFNLLFQGLHMLYSC